MNEKCLLQKDTNLPKCVSCSTCEEDKTFGPFCGTNNRTYNSLCEILWDSCRSGYFIEANNVGPCKSSKFFKRNFKIFCLPRGFPSQTRSKKGSSFSPVIKFSI